jgi:DNA polymerase-3 subunit epsilon
MKLSEPWPCFPTGKHYPGIAHLVRLRVVGVAEEFAADASWMDLPIAFLDTETTGTDPRMDRIIEVGIVMGQGGEIGARHSWLINPGVPIPKESTEIHGISDPDVKDKPAFEQVAAEVSDALRGALPAAYNASFDRRFLFAEMERAGYQETNPPPATRRKVVWLDPLVFARELYKGQGESRALGAVAERLGVSLDNAHRATDDAEAALRVLYKMAADERIPKAYGALIQEQRRLEAIQLEAQRFWRR